MAQTVSPKIARLIRQRAYLSGSLKDLETRVTSIQAQLDAAQAAVAITHRTLAEIDPFDQRFNVGPFSLRTPATTVSAAPLPSPGSNNSRITKTMRRLGWCGKDEFGTLSRCYGLRYLLGILISAGSVLTDKTYNNSRFAHFNSTHGCTF